MRDWKHCDKCHVTHEMCECGLPIWKNPMTGRILDAHGDGTHRCPDSYWQKVLSKLITETDVRPTRRPAKPVKAAQEIQPPKQAKKFTGGIDV